VVRARVYITPKADILDPAGKAVERSLHALGFADVTRVRLGKYVELEIGGEPATAEQRLDDMCRRLLANGVIEDYRFEIEA
jgi:phosphoribosylformylglycinamidine synthase